MKKLKLVMSIATMCLAIAVLCFGVLAATSVTYTIQGTISYDVEDVYVDVNTTVYKSAKYLSGTEQNTLLESLGNPANLSSAQTTYELVETGDSNSFSTLNTESPTPLSGLALTFNKDVKTYAIVVNVKNLTDKNAWAVVDSRTSTSTNVKIVDNYQLEISKTADTNGKNVVIVVTPKDVTQSIENTTTFTFNLVFGSGAYVDSTTNMSKMNISGNSATKASANISGVLAIPSSVTSIGNGAFYECSSLTSIEIPSSVTSIGNSAFKGCSSLTSIEIPSSVTSIGNYPFDGCSGLESITVSGTGGTYTAQGNCLIKGTELVAGCKTSVIPTDGSVTSIGNYAFKGCSSLTSITIPEGVTSIGDSAFYGCSSLTSITIPSSVTSMRGSVFYGCRNLTSITIPSSVTSIAAEVFYGCSSLTSITIPESVTSIGKEAFYGCSSLASITIPSSVTNIGYGAFNGCSSLTSITIPEGVTSIDSEAFKGCSSLSSITIPSRVTRIGDWAFYGCSSLTSITIPRSVTSIGESAFWHCSSLTSATFEYKTWKIGNKPLDLRSTSTSTNATYLTSTYAFGTWTKTA